MITSSWLKRQRMCIYEQFGAVSEDHCPYYKSRVDSSWFMVKESARLAGVVCLGASSGYLKSEVVPRNSGASFEEKKGQRLRIIGKSIVDLVLGITRASETASSRTKKGTRYDSLPL